MAVLLGACGGESSSDSNERAGTYDVEVTGAEFPSDQVLGQTSLLHLSLKNAGDETVPTLTVTIGIDGEDGRDASLPFGINDRQAGLAQATRPVWILAATYPRLLDSEDPGGGGTSNPKTFTFGPLKAGETTDVVWKLSAVRQGRYTLAYRVGAGLSAEVHAETESGVTPGGTFVTEISPESPDVEVTDSGEIVELGADRGKGGAKAAGKGDAQ